MINALNAAAQAGHVADKAVFHSDLGTQYTSDTFATWRARDIITGLGHTEGRRDNATAEPLFAGLKNECHHQTTFSTRAAHLAVADHIEVFYNW